MEKVNAIQSGYRRANIQDEVFLEELFTATNENLNQLPLDMRKTLAAMQYRARAASYKAQFPEAENRILCLEDGTPIGRHLVERGAGEIRTVDLAILPSYQGQGVGSSELQTLQQECKNAGLTHMLSVAIGNRAERLYRRLGFVVISDDGIYRLMRWSF